MDCGKCSGRISILFNNADDDVRRRIVDIAKNHDWNFCKATEEYLAGLAERTEFEKAKRSPWWQKIKNFFAQMLNKIGLPGFNGITLFLTMNFAIFYGEVTRI